MENPSPCGFVVDPTVIVVPRFGSGVDPVPLTEEFTSLLGSLFEPAGSNPWLVDWLWTLYETALQPFLCLAGPASDGTAVNSFREYWQSLPWQKATFHCISPGTHRLRNCIIGRRMFAPWSQY